MEHKNLNNQETANSDLGAVISSNRAVEEAVKMLRIPMKDLPELAMEFLKHLSKQVGFCGETCITAYAGYNQMVLKMECEDDLYKITQPDLLQWWADKGYYL